VPDERTVRGRGVRLPPPVPAPDHGVYLVGSDPGPFPWSSRSVCWRDLQRPFDTGEAGQLSPKRSTGGRPSGSRSPAVEGSVVPGCGLAVVTIWAGVQPGDAISWVRA